MTARSPALKLPTKVVAVPQAVVEFQSELAAVIETPYPRAARSLLYVLSLMVALALVLLCVLHLDRVVTGPGRLLSRNSSIQMQPLDNSIVRSILVQPGDEVRKGDLLVTLDPTFTTADASQLRQQVTSLSAEVDRLTAEAGKVPYAEAADRNPAATLQFSLWRSRQAQYQASLANYDQKIASAQATLSRSQRDIDYFKSRLGVNSEIETMRSKLEQQQFGSRLNTLLAQDNRTEIARTLASAEEQARTAQHDMDALRSERESFLQDWAAQIAQNLTDKRVALQQARDDLSKAERMTELVELRAPEDASVLSVADVSLGSVAKAGDTLVSLVPASAPLEVEVDVDGADQGQIKVGDKVQIKLDAYRFIEYGLMQGKVRSVSRDSFTTQDNGTPSQRRFFRARVEITDYTLRGLPAGQKPHLVPGMPLQADIVVGRRRAIMYILETVLRQSAEAMREP